MSRANNRFAVQSADSTAEPSESFADLVGLIETAPVAVPELAAAALNEVLTGVITGEGPTTKGRPHFSRTLDAQDALLCERILVAAGGPEVPPPLVEQLAPNGRLLIPLGEQGAQTLTLVERVGPGGHEVRRTPLGAARFVPLLGEHGFNV